MKLRNPLMLACVLAIAAPAAASGPSTTGALATPANRIVGLWSNIARVGSCETGTLGPPLPQTLMYNAGGTFVDNPRFPPQGITSPAGVIQRTIGMGVWIYTPATGQHSVRQQFDFYLNNVYDGYQVIETTRELSHDGNTLTGPVLASRYNAAGALVSQLCGEAVSTRL